MDYLVCRICRQKTKSCTSLDNDFEGFNHTIEKALQICCGVNLERKEGIPTSICDFCLDELNITYNFVEKFRESEKFFKYQLASKQVVIEQTAVPSSSSFIQIEVNVEKSPEEVAVVKEEPPIDLDENIIERVSPPPPPPKEPSPFRATFVEYVANTGGEDALEDVVCVVSDDESDHKSEANPKQSDSENEGKAVEMDGNVVRRCSECPKWFADRKGLRAHKLQSHEKQYQCSFCKKRFSRQSDLKYHKKSAHLGEQVFKCLICEKSYYHSNSLTSHMRIHKFKDVHCKHCGIEITNLKEWNYHQKLHPEAIYECKTCGVTFIEKHK